MSKQVIENFSADTVTELVSKVLHFTRTLPQSRVLVSTNQANRLYVSLVEETLTDGSKVYDLIFR